VAPPLIAECPLNLECKVLAEHEVGDHQLLLGQVLVEHVDADRLGDDGKPDARKLDMLIYAANNYFAAGQHLGTHGLSKDRL
jgi:flavin reductase (DIM6/NTAB) family NADH-FMN oxidoreductase RutF